MKNDRYNKLTGNRTELIKYAIWEIAILFLGQLMGDYTIQKKGSRSQFNSINDICRGASMSITRISKLRKYLVVKTTELLIHAFVRNKLDYCNSLLYGLPSSEIQ